MGCEEVFGFIDDYYDDLLSDDLRILIDKHLGECYKCNTSYNEMSNYFQQLKTFSNIIDKPTTLQNEIIEELTGEKPKEEIKPKKSAFGFFKRTRT